MTIPSLPAAALQLAMGGGEGGLDALAGERQAPAMRDDVQHIPGHQQFFFSAGLFSLGFCCGHVVASRSTNEEAALKRSAS
jgi:hypothetical protein